MFVCVCVCVCVCVFVCVCFGDLSVRKLWKMLIFPSLPSLLAPV